jgi:exopolysaccharide production protein ExoZ
LLFNLQFLRGLAALGVAFWHTDFRLAGDWHTDFSGVAIFFVISGFIMCFITRDNADDFLKMRLARIVPFYWLCTFALVFFMYRFAVFKPSTWLTAPAWRPEEPFWVYVGRGLLFLPSEQSPALGVGWTLNFEMYFYVVFALALWINRQLAPLIVAAFLIAVFYSDGTVCTLFVCHYYSHEFIWYFAAGIALFYIWTLGSFFACGWAVAAISAAGLIFFYGSQFAHPFWPDWLLASKWWLPPFVVACALFMESSGAPITWRLAILLGDASYSLYLTHTIFYEVARPLLQAWRFPTPKDSFAVMLFEVITATLIGIVVHLYLEKPLLRKVRHVLADNRKTSERVVVEPR